MKKKIVMLICTITLTATMMGGCGSATKTESASEPAEVAKTEEAVEEEEAEESDDTVEEDADLAAANHVAELIDAIYVQERTDKTDEQCAEAKAAWDALTDAQKELVEGEEADPDYFGRDTGDASLDDPLNADEIGENELLVVSFGTSFNDSRAKDIKGIEDALKEAFPDWSVRRAFTAQIIINHVQAREGEKIDNMDQALERAVDNGVKNLVVQPTHLMHGAEYDELCEALDNYADKFETIKIAEPLLGEVGSDATVINADKEAVAKAITAAAVADAGYEDAKAAADDGVAFVFMGHGTSHTAKVSYSQMQTQMNALKYDNVFIGTVEGEPEETACENVIEAVSNAGFKKVILRPLMVVAGDHANNDMAGDDEDSWKSMFLASSKFDTVDTQISGLGSIADVQKLYVEHSKTAIETEAEANEAMVADGEYTIDVTMEGGSGKAKVDSPAKISVKNGEITATLVWSSKNYDYMLVDNEKYLPVNTEGNSVFEVPVKKLDTGLVMIGDTTAMSKPHEVEYTFTFISDTIKAE